ncbi:MAG TPA: DUF1127 domain-containing protein [Alphaproteobacteria bacterium]|nr:DUF1127 domain-containing protein [Alphaproteobacteria bacterium]
MNGTLCHTSQIPAAAMQPRSPVLSAALLRTVDTVLLWHDRSKSRRMLATLDDRMLRDVGIDQATAQREAERPFWR